MNMYKVKLKQQFSVDTKASVGARIYANSFTQHQFV